MMPHSAVLCQPLGAAAKGEARELPCVTVCGSQIHASPGRAAHPAEHTPESVQSLPCPEAAQQRLPAWLLGHASAVLSASPRQKGFRAPPRPTSGCTLRVGGCQELLRERHQGGRLVADAADAQRLGRDVQGQHGYEACQVCLQPALDQASSACAQAKPLVAGNAHQPPCPVPVLAMCSGLQQVTAAWRRTGLLGCSCTHGPSGLGSVPDACDSQPVHPPHC